MIIILSAAAFILLSTCIRLYFNKKEMERNLQYITGKLTHIIEKQSKERLVIFTGEKHLQKLLVEMNRLLDYHHEYIADSSRVRLSMNRMLSNISHDLKTPITVILGYIETIRNNSSLPLEEREKMLASVYGKAIGLTNLIHQFFDLARLESGDWPLEMRPLHINEVCRHSILAYYDTLTAKGFDVRIDIPSEPFFIQADEVAVTRVLNNLLSNAITHGIDGKVIGLKLHQAGEYISVEVWDAGKGIAEKECGRIFERLYTINDSRSSSVKGSGIGLTVAKGLTEQMNGRIELSSTPNRRTAFTLTFRMIHGPRDRALLERRQEIANSQR